MAFLKLYLSETIKESHKSFLSFCQMMANRIMVGNFRYGKINKRQNYRKRIDSGLRHYDETGNQEFLVDVANYCWLEINAPSRPDAFFEASDSNGKDVILKTESLPWQYRREGD